MSTAGLVTAKQQGSVVITASARGASGSATIVVDLVPAFLVMPPAPDTLRSLGDTARIVPEVQDSAHNPFSPLLTWTSASPSIASVSPSGRVTAADNGETYVRAAIKSLKDSVRVLVRQRPSAAGSLLTATPDTLVPDETSTLKLQVRDARGHNIAFASGLSVAFSVGGGSATGSVGSVTDNGNGTYTAVFTAGDYGTPLTFSGTLEGTPFGATNPAIVVVGFVRIAVTGQISYGQTAVSGGVSCGILNTEQMYCWGSNWTLGEAPQPVPTLVLGGHHWRDLSVGVGRLCGVTTGNELYCWNSLSTGGGSGSFPSSTRPQLVTTASPVQSVSVDILADACELGTNGAAYCWGSNLTGRIGNGGSADAAAPTPVAGGNTYGSISTAYSGTCAITVAGAAYCWGGWALLNVATPSDMCINNALPCSLIPIAVDPGFAYDQNVVTDGGVACATRIGGVTQCWGSGYVGNGGQGRLNPPGPLTGNLVLTTITTSDNSWCGSSTTKSYCWGDNRAGQLGNGDTAEQLSPVEVQGGRHFLQMGVSQGHGCGITARGEAYCWGMNDKGELGDGTQTQRLVPVKVKLHGS